MLLTQHPEMGAAKREQNVRRQVYNVKKEIYEVLP